VGLYIYTGVHVCVVAVISSVWVCVRMLRVTTVRVRTVINCSGKNGPGKNGLGIIGLVVTCKGR